MISSPHAILRSSRVLLSAFALVGFLGAPAYADPVPGDTVGNSESADDFLKNTLGASGSLRTAYWSQDKTFTETHGYSVDSLWVTLRPKEVNGFKFYLDGYVQEQNLTRKVGGYSDLREAYVEKSFGSFDFKIGRQITVWGRADRVNPTDNLSVSNLKLLTTDVEDQRLGVTAAQVAYNLGQHQLIGIYIPEWRAPTYPLQSSPGTTFSDVPKNGAQNQFGLKLDNSGGAVDWSVSYFDGFSKTPDLAVLSTGATGLDVGLNYNRIRVLGSDFAVNLGGFGFRGEAAYTRTENSDGANPLVQDPNVFVVLGGDRTFVENFNVNVQAMYQHVYDFHNAAQTSDPDISALALTEAISTNQQFQDQAGMTFRPSYKMFNETLEMELAFVRWFGKGDSVMRPKVTYAFNDTFKGIIGGELYSGPSDSRFGQLSQASAVFAELRCNF